MHLGIIAKTFVRPTLAEVLAAVVQHGLRCVQFNFSCAGLPTLPERIEPDLADSIRRELDQRQIVMAALSATFNMIHPDLEHRRAGLDRLRVAASACSRLGTAMITLCTGTRDPQDMWRRHPENDSAGAWRDLVASLEDALQTAEASQVTLGIEPEVGNVVNSARKARRLLDEIQSPRLGIIMDAANLFHPGDLPRQREILDEAFDLLGGDIVLAHAKELRPDGHAGHLALGAGVLDWDHYLALLRRVKFTGPLVMHGFAEPDVAASVTFMRGKLAADATDETLQREGERPGKSNVPGGRTSLPLS